MKRYKCLTNNYDISGIYKGFTYPSNKQLLSGKTVSDRVYDYPEDWEMIEDFILPKMWAIKVESHNKDIIYKWKIENTNCSRKSKVDTFTFSDGMYGSSLEQGYTEITFEQFKEHVLKEKPMKKIIGYKLKRDCKRYKKAAEKIADNRVYEGSKYDFKNHCNTNRLKEAGVLDLWFKPVYKEEFKVGDWVIRTEGNHGIHAKGRVLKISNILGKSFESEQDSSGSHIFGNVRKATPEEIKSAQIALPKINGYDGKMVQNNQFIKYGCATMDIDALEGIYSSKVLSCDRSLRSVKLDSGVQITMDQIKQMLDYVNNL